MIHRLEIDYLSNDREWQQLVAYLDSCSASRGGCDKCALQIECTKKFDYLTDRALDGRLQREDRIKFENRFKKFHKQLTLV